MTKLFDLYHEIAARLLGLKDFPLPLPEWDRNYPHNVGLLSDAKESELAAAVLNKSQGLSIDEWKTMDMGQRLPWMRIAFEKARKEGQSDRNGVMSQLIARAQANALVLTAAEMEFWPDGLLDELTAKGILVQDGNAKTIACDSCGDDHVETVEYVQSKPNSELRAYIKCPVLGRVDVPLKCLRQWTINPSKMQVVEVNIAKTETNDEPLSVRAQYVLIAMQELGAIDSDNRKTNPTITSKAFGPESDPNALKGVMADLRKLGLIQSKRGSGGGAWLTKLGHQRAHSLSKS